MLEVVSSLAVVVASNLSRKKQKGKRRKEKI